MMRHADFGCQFIVGILDSNTELFPRNPSPEKVFTILNQVLKNVDYSPRAICQRVILVFRAFVIEVVQSGVSRINLCQKVFHNLFLLNSRK